MSASLTTSELAEQPIARVLQNQLVMMKKLEEAPTECNSQRVKDERFAFANWLMGKGIRQHLITRIVDEAGINLWCRRTRAAPRGSRAVQDDGGFRGNNLTMAFCSERNRWPRPP